MSNPNNDRENKIPEARPVPTSIPVHDGVKGSVPRMVDPPPTPPPPPPPTSEEE